MGEAVPDGWVRQVETTSDHALGYAVGGRVLVVVNPGDEPAAFDADTDGWRLVAVSDADGGTVDLNGMVDFSPRRIVPAKGVRVWVRD